MAKESLPLVQEYLVSLMAGFALVEDFVWVVFNEVVLLLVPQSTGE